MHYDIISHGCEYLDDRQVMYMYIILYSVYSRLHGQFGSLCSKKWEIVY
jgi:hypothetical protein